MPLEAVKFNEITGFIKMHSGIVITQDKEYLLETRLMPIASKYGCHDLDALIDMIKTSPNGDIKQDVVEAMTTNETLFFRDQKPFDLLKTEIIPKLFQEKKDKEKYRIWSAASSTGQEAYSLALMLKESPVLKPEKFEIFGTDIDLKAVSKARQGLYTQFEVQRGLPIMMLLKYFKQIEDRWQINDDLKNMVKFEVFNLLNQTAGFGKFDIVFCRNVLIYFDQDTKVKVLKNIAANIEVGGILMLGTAETILNMDVSFKQYLNMSGVYQKI